jgi:predicted Rossmann fold nucleotide-binding protein DprA/Smf involved in DNA uptake
MSHQTLSTDTEIVLLLCGRFGGERQELFQPLSAREYGVFAKWLNECGLRPADLLSDLSKANLAGVHEAKLEHKRIDFLLGRGMALALAMERWSRGGLWVISRGDPDYPKRLKRHLKHAAPPLLYGAGDKSLLEVGGLAIIGSRDTTDTALEFTRTIASKCAHEQMGVVSGGARGVDSAAMQGATEAGGVSIGVLANDLLKTSMNRQNRTGLQDGHLVLISPFSPEAGFNAGNAMARNKYIYTMADRALVVDSALGSGGTWEGACENLRHNWVPLYVRAPGDGLGNTALVEKGGIAFTPAMNTSEPLSDYFAQSVIAKPQNILDAESLQQSFLEASDDVATPPNLLSTSSVAVRDSLHQKITPLEPVTAVLVTRQDTEALNVSEFLAAVVTEQPTVDVLDMFGDFLTKLAKVLATGPKNEEQVASELGIEKGQAKAWLNRAIEAGIVEKLKKPVRFSLSIQHSLC